MSSHMLHGFRSTRRVSIPAIAVAAALMLAACGGDPPADRTGAAPLTTATPAPGATAPPTPGVTPSPSIALPSGPPSIESAGAAKIHISPAADWLAIAYGSVWTAAGPGIVRLDPLTGEPGPVTEILGICLAFDVGYDSLWAGGCDDPAIWRIDPANGVVLAQIPLEVDGIEEEGSVAAGEGGVWVVSTAHELVKIDPATNEVVGTWPLPVGAAAVRAGLGSLWVTVSGLNQLLRIDPDDPTTHVPIDVGAFPRFLAVGEDAVWVMNQDDASVSRVAADGSLVATIPFGTGPMEGGDIAVGGGSVWVQPNGLLLVQMDPATNEVVARYGPASGSGSVAADGAAVWVSAHDVEAIWRLPLP